MATKKTATVKRVQSTGTWTTTKEPIKTFYKFEVEMDNGDIGEYSSVSQDQTKFVQGQETDYEFIPGKFPKIKPYYESQNSTGGGTYYSSVGNPREDSIARSVALKCATEYALGSGLELTELLKTATAMNNFLTSCSENKNPIKKDDNDNLPF